MHPPRRLWHAALFAAITALGACNDTSTTPNENRPGTVRFDFSGTISGTFDVNGAVRTDDNTGGFVYQPFAFAALQSFGSSILAFQPTTRPRGNAFEIRINDRVAGTYSTDLDTCELRCAVIFYVHDLDFEGNTGDGRIFESVSGEVEVTQFSTDAIVGRFDGVVLADLDDATATVELTSGTFSVSLLEDASLRSRSPLEVGTLP